MQSSLLVGSGYSYTSKSWRGKEFTWSKWSELWRIYTMKVYLVKMVLALARILRLLCSFGRCLCRFPSLRWCLRYSSSDFLNFVLAFKSKLFFLHIFSFPSLCCNCKFYIAVRSVKSQFGTYYVSCEVKFHMRCEMLYWRSALFPQHYSPCASRAITAWSCLMTEEKAYGITVTWEASWDVIEMTISFAEGHL